MAGIGLGALAAACLALNGAACSSSNEAPYDAGVLPDVFFGGDDATAPDATAPSEGGSDATSGSDSSRPPEDAGDASLPVHRDGGGDGATGMDAAPPANGGDASDSSAGDGSRADAGDASIGVSDATAPVHAADASEASDSSDESEVSPADAAAAEDAAGDGSALCATFDPSSDPIRGVAAFDGTQLVEEDSTNGSIAGTGTASYGDTVSIQAWTIPAGIMESLYVVYTTDGFATHTQVALASAGLTDAGPVAGGPGNGGVEAWSGPIPPQAHGTTVVWYVAGADACTGATHYFSNNGSNYQYATP